MRPEAIEAMSAHLHLVGNPSALHIPGQRARRALEDARERLAAALGAHPSEVILTSGGSEADSLALLGSLAGRAGEQRPRALVSAIEHPAVLGLRDHGAEELAVTSEGVVDVEQARARIDKSVAVVSVMSVNNETGIIQPLEELRRRAVEMGAWFHTDAVQALGHVPCSFRDSSVDMMSVSAHKVGGPVGVGALLARRSLKLKPIGLGGGQEREVRSGTAMVALAAGFAAAATQAMAELEAETARLRAFQQRIFTVARSQGAVVNTDAAPHAPHICNLTFPGLRANDLLFLLDQRGIHASVGSACRAGVHQPSEVLLAMGRSEQDAASTVRISLGHSTTEDDVAALERELPRVLQLARLVG